MPKNVIHVMDSYRKEVAGMEKKLNECARAAVQGVDIVGSLDRIYGIIVRNWIDL